MSKNGQGQTSGCDNDTFPHQQSQGDFVGTFSL